MKLVDYVDDDFGNTFREARKIILSFLEPVLCTAYHQAMNLIVKTDMSQQQCSSIIFKHFMFHCNLIQRHQSGNQENQYSSSNTQQTLADRAEAYQGPAT